MGSAEEAVLAYVAFPASPRAKLHSTNPVEWLNGEIRRCTDVVGIFPNEAAAIRLIDVILLKQSDDWTIQRPRHMPLEIVAAVSDTGQVRLGTVLAWCSGPARQDLPFPTLHIGTRLMITGSHCRGARSLLGWFRVRLAAQVEVPEMVVQWIESNHVLPSTRCQQNRAAFEAARVQFVVQNGVQAGVHRNGSAA